MGNNIQTVQSKYLGRGSPNQERKTTMLSPNYQSSGASSERSKILQGIHNLTSFKSIAPESATTSSSTSGGIHMGTAQRAFKYAVQDPSAAFDQRMRAFIKVSYSSERFMYIALFDENEEEDPQDLTSGWLLSESIRKFNQIQSHQHTELENSVPVSLSTVNNQSECIDLYLTQMHKQLIKFLTFSQEIQTDIILADQELTLNFVPKADWDVYQEKSLRQRVEIPTLRDYDMLKVLGTGGFSQVLLVRRRMTGKLYAMKLINKKHIVDSDKVDQIISERKIFSMLNHPFIVQLHSAFTSKNYLYLVLDLCPGGELFYYISKVKKFSEKQAKIIFAEILLTIEHLHDKNILYRDLKPENILIDEMGHIKLTDFGLSKMNFAEQDLSMTFCGSPEYMSPEMLTQRGHNFKLDIYCLGVLFYELLVGLPPHYNANRIKMYQDIVQCPEKYPSSMSKDAKSLLMGMLEKDPERRLSIQQIKHHSFCRDIDWEKLIKKEIDPPISVDHRISNFESEYTQMEIKISAELEDEQLSPERYPHTEANNRNKMRKTKSSQYIDTLERIQTENSKERPKKSFKKQMRTHKNVMKRMINGHQTSQNVFIINKHKVEIIEDEDFTAEVRKSNMDAGLTSQLQILEGTSRSKKTLTKEITPTFKEFLYRRQTINKMLGTDFTIGTEVYSPEEHGTRESIALQMMLNDNVEMFNANSINPSILTEHADNMQINIQTMHQFNDQISKNLSSYSANNPQKQVVSLSQANQKRKNDADLGDSVIEEEHRLEDDLSSVSSRMKSLVGNVRIELPQKSESYQDREVEIQEEDDDEVVEFHFERVDSIKSEDHTPMYKKLSNNLSKLIEENFYYYKNSELMHTEEGNINDSQIVGRKSLNTMSPIIREQKGYPQRGHIQKHMTQLQLNNYKNEIEDIRELLQSDFQPKLVGTKMRHSENLLLLTEKMNGIFSERNRESNLKDRMQSIIEEEQLSKYDASSQHTTLQPVHKPSNYKCQQKDHLASQKQLDQIPFSSAKKSSSKLFSQYTQQVNIETSPHVSLLVQQTKSPMRKLRSQESFIPAIQYQTQDGKNSRQPSNFRKQNSTATSQSRKQTTQLRSNSQLRSVIQSGQLQQQSSQMMTSLKKKADEASKNMKHFQTQEFKKPKKATKGLLHCQTQNESLCETLTNQSSSQLGIVSTKSRNLNLKQVKSNQQSSTNGSIKNGASQIAMPSLSTFNPSTTKHGSRPPSKISQPTIFNFKTKDNQMQQSQVQSEQESFLSVFRTQENRSCRPSLAKQKLAEAANMNQLQNQTFSDNLKALTKKLSLKNSAQQACQWEEVKDQGVVSVKGSIKRATSNERVNSQQRRLQSTISSQLSMQNTLNKHKKSLKPNEKVLQSQLSKHQQAQKDVKITNKTYLRKLNSHQQHESSMNQKKELMIQEVEKGKRQVKPTLIKQQSLNKNSMVASNAVSVVLEQEDSPMGKTRKSKISDGMGDSVTEFEVESSINKSIFRQSPSLAMIDEVTPRQKVLSPKHPPASIKEAPSQVVKQTKIQLAQSPRESKKEKKLTGSGSNLSSALFRSINKKSDAVQQSSAQAPQSAKNPALFGRRKTQEVEGPISFSQMQSMEHHIRLTNKDSSQISINLKKLPHQVSKFPSSSNSTKQILQDDQNLTIRVTEMASGEYNLLKSKANGSKLFATDNNRQNQSRMFSPTIESNNVRMKASELGLLHNEIDKYKTKQGKKIRDLDVYTTTNTPYEYGKGSNSSIHNQSQTAAQISFDNYNQQTLSQNYKELVSSYSLSATKKQNQHSLV